MMPNTFQDHVGSTVLLEILIYHNKSYQYYSLLQDLNFLNFGNGVDFDLIQSE